MTGRFLLVASLVLLCAVPARADDLKIQSSPAPAGGQRSWNVDGVDFTSAEVEHLFEGLKIALDEKGTAINVTLAEKTPAELPPYDQTWHCPDPKIDPGNVPHITVWVAESAAKDPKTFAKALEACIFSGLAATGYGGPKWKALYDSFAAKDAALGANAPNPMLNRNEFAVQLMKFYEAVISGKIAASPSPSP